MNKFVQKTSEQVAKASLAVTKMNVNSNCWFCYNQPKLPSNATKLRKF